MMMEKQSIFITGAASGIGRATALYFAEKGWFVGLFDIDETGLSELSRRIGEDRSCCRPMDVTRQESVKEAVRHFSQHTGQKMDVLFNCAGILRMGPHHRIDIDDQKQIVAVNLTGILHCIHECLSILKKTPGSAIVNMSSASAVYGSPELAVYSATKFAVRGLTEALNIEFEALGIRVSHVMAPYVQTPMILDAKVQAISVGRLGVHITPEQVAKVVWRAAHGNRVQWRVGALIQLLVFGMWSFPFARRFLVKTLAFHR
ncbi:MAG: SDR family oxidoreductase [Desulfobacterales bacterium]|nr:SDR family oxidoreductase [Desulfobacterales bacterium]